MGFRRRTLTDDEIEANKKIAASGRSIAEKAAKRGDTELAKGAGDMARRAERRVATGKTLRGRIK